MLAALPQLYELDLSAFTLPVFIDLLMNHPGRFSELILVQSGLGGWAFWISAFKVQ